MIRVIKPNRAPTILTTTGASQTTADRAAFEADPQAYRRTTRNRAKFKHCEYYNDKSVKTALLNAHHNKCCYCEKKDKSRGNFDVEHFRPRAGMKQSRNQKIEYPGYFWLAYVWNNLLLSCKDCNRNKWLLFPLVDDTQRARPPDYDVTKEHPLFINPSRRDLDPRDHIRFDNDAPVAMTRYGRSMIDEIGLDRPDLRESRLELIERLNEKITDLGVAKEVRRLYTAGKCDRNLLNMAQEKERQAKEYLTNAVKPQAPFSSMVMDYLARPEIVKLLT